MLHIWSRSQELEQSEMALHGIKPSCFGYFLSLFTASLESIVVSNVMDSSKSLVGILDCFIIEIIESFGSEGTPRGHLVQPACSEQGHR